VKKRLLSLLLALALLAVPVHAAKETTLIPRTKTYEGQFSDLASDSVFYDNVAALYEYGLSVGKADGTFGMQDSVTVGQAIIFAGRLRSLYVHGEAETGAAPYRLADQPQRAYEPYLFYLQAEGILEDELDGTYGSAATRAQVAHILAGTLPQEALPPINEEMVSEGYARRQYITDVTEYTDYYQDILSLYRAGISQGSNKSGDFYPDQPITRGAVAAMLTRMADPALRITVDWTADPAFVSAAGRTLASLIPPADYIAAPITDEEMDQAIRSMLAADASTLVLKYPSLDAARSRAIMQQALIVAKTYCEQCYNTVSCTYMIDGSLTLTFSAAGAEDDLPTYRAAAMASAIAVHDQLWLEGRIHSGMSEREKALVYYTWICENSRYDYDAAADSLSHIAYGLFSDGLAVCDGYTGAYNMLLKLEGIQCTTLANDEHIWTVATLDGIQYHIDPTWGDSNRAIRYDYFAMTPGQSWIHHPW